MWTTATEARWELSCKKVASNVGYCKSVAVAVRGVATTYETLPKNNRTHWPDWFGEIESEGSQDSVVLELVQPKCEFLDPTFTIAHSRPGSRP